MKNEDGARTTSTYDVANQLQTAVDASGTTTYVFDADGNQELVVEPNGDRTTTTWDYENRATLVQQPSGIRNTMAYEPDWLRVKLEEPTGTKKFIWDEQNYLAEADENDDTQVVYTNEPRVYGNLVSQRRGTDSHWYHFDAIGSTRELTDSVETISDTRLYDAWGSAVSSTGLSLFPFQFIGSQGYYFDSEPGSVYIRARVYIPGLGRWRSRDPLLFADGLNLYEYVVNSPVVFVDPSGEKCCVCSRHTMTEDPWTAFAGGVVETFPGPASTRPVNAQNESARKLLCIVGKELTVGYLCHPDCFGPAGPPATTGNLVTLSTYVFADKAFIEHVDEGDNIGVLVVGVSAAPFRWPVCLPFPLDIELLNVYDSPASETAAHNKCAAALRAFQNRNGPLNSVLEPGRVTPAAFECDCTAAPTEIPDPPFAGYTPPEPNPIDILDEW